MKYIWCNNIKCEPHCKSTKSDSLCWSCKHKDICMDSSLKEQINHERKCVISCDMICKEDNNDR